MTTDTPVQLVARQTLRQALLLVRQCGWVRPDDWEGAEDPRLTLCLACERAAMLVLPHGPQRRWVDATNAAVQLVAWQRCVDLLNWLGDRETSSAPAPPGGKVSLAEAIGGLEVWEDQATEVSVLQLLMRAAQLTNDWDKPLATMEATR